MKTLKEVEQELLKLRNDCSADDWDGYGALPVAPVVVDVALSMVRGLPEGAPMPDCMGTPDGEIDLEWELSHGDIVSVRVNSGETDEQGAIVCWDGPRGSFVEVKPDGRRTPKEVLDRIVSEGRYLADRERKEREEKKAIIDFNNKVIGGFEELLATLNDLGSQRGEKYSVRVITPHEGTGVGVTLDLMCSVTETKSVFGELDENSLYSQLAAYINGMRRGMRLEEVES